MLEQEILGNTIMAWLIAGGVILVAFLVGRMVAHGMKLAVPHS